MLWSSGRPGIGHGQAVSYLPRRKAEETVCASVIIHLRAGEEDFDSAAEEIGKEEASGVRGENEPALLKRNEEEKETERLERMRR